MSTTTEIPQSMRSLESANDVRLARVELKRAIKRGDVLVAEILRSDIPDWLEGLAVERLALAIPRFQRQRYRLTMDSLPARLTATVGDLTERKRHLLAERIEAFETRPPRRRRRAPTNPKEEP